MSLPIAKFFFAIVLSFLVGLIVGHYKLFPFEQLYAIKKHFIPSQGQSTYFYNRVSFFEGINHGSYDLVFLGDSITDIAEWQEMFPSLKVANRGINGDTTQGVLRRLDSVNSYTPGKIFIMLGVNDIYAGLNIQEISDNYKEIIEKTSYNHKHIYIQSTLMANGPRAFLNKKIKLLNKNLIEIAKQYKNVSYIDLNMHLSKPGHLEARYTNDGIHLNHEGYAIWKKAITPYTN